MRTRGPVLIAHQPFLSPDDQRNTADMRFGDSEQVANPTSLEYRRHPIYSPNEWLFEGMSSLLAMGIVIAIAVIFWKMDGKRLDEWRGPVSLTATISILTTAYASALMHSVSSFIGQLKWLHFKDGPRRLSHLETFDKASRGVLGALLLLTSVNWNLATIGAVITILRLTFSAFSQQAVLIVQSDSLRSSDAGSVAFGYAHNYSRDFSRFTTYGNTGQKAIPQDPDMQFAILQGLYGISTPATFSCPSSCRWDGSYISLGNQCNMTTPNGDKLLEIARFGIYRSSPDGNFRQQNVNITQCSLYITAYEYINAIANGILFRFLETREIGYPISDRETIFRTNETKTEDNNTIPALQIGEWDLQALHNFFESATISTEWVEGNWPNPNPGPSAALKGDVNITARFDHMATTMTEYLRNGPNMMLAEGVILESVPYVSIRWRFFVVPVLTEVLALLFAVLTIVRNRRSQKVPLWKSSTLAVLACQVDERSRLLKGDPDGRDVDELLKEAKKTEVRLH
ncbi:hypothetical protein BDV11DRAFT_204324 [Aspergillus similis]